MLRAGLTEDRTLKGPQQADTQRPDPGRRPGPLGAGAPFMLSTPPGRRGPPARPSLCPCLAEKARLVRLGEAGASPSCPLRRPQKAKGWVVSGASSRLLRGLRVSSPGAQSRDRVPSVCCGSACAETTPPVPEQKGQVKSVPSATWTLSHWEVRPGSLAHSPCGPRALLHLSPHPCQKGCRLSRSCPRGAAACPAPASRTPRLCECHLLPGPPGLESAARPGA